MPKQKKKYVIYPRTKGIVRNGMPTGKGTLEFGNSPMIFTEDSTLASEVETQYGKDGTGDAYVVEDERVSRFARNDKSEIHNYFFGPNRRYADGWERIFGKKVKNAPKKENTQNL